MTAYIELFERMKRFLDFGPADAEHLLSLRPYIRTHGAAVTEHFYERILAEPETASFVEGKLERLKKTHQQWLDELFGGVYDGAYFHSRWRIGLAHVRIGMASHWVEATISTVRAELLTLLGREIKEPEVLSSKSVSVLKACDLDLMIINLSYAEDRIARLTDFTGMKRPLIENIIRLAKS